MLGTLVHRTSWLVAALSTAIGASAMADCDHATQPVVLNPQFVRQVAAGYSLDLRGDRMIVGDPEANVDITGSRGSQGRAAIYERDATGAWIQTVTLAPQFELGNLERPRFGTAVAIADDVAVVAYQHEWVQLPHANSAIHFFQRSVDSQGTIAWSKAGEWVFPDAFSTVFIAGIALAGNTAVVASENRDAVTFTRDSSAPFGWRLDTETIPARASGGGPTRALAFDGQYAVFGRFGSAKVFERTPGGWVLRSDLPGRAGDSAYGMSVSLDGDLIAIGSNREPGPGVVGYVRLFRRAADGTWPLEAELEHPTINYAPPKTGFGMGVALRGDRLAVGAYKDSFSGIESGAVHVFERTANQWRGIATYSLPNSESGWLGWNVALTDDTLATGAIGLNGTGGVVLFDRCAINATPGDTTPRCLPGIFGLLTFLDAYFSGSPFADFNHSGTISVQDIFDYLAAWCAGCP